MPDPASLPVPVEPLTAEGFAAFGEVIAPRDLPVAMNDGSALRHADLATAVPGEDGRVTIGLVECRSAAALPLAVRLMERHPLATQAFVPLAPFDFLVVAAPPQPAPVRAATLRAFRARAGQGINYGIGVWHHPLLALAAGQRFLVVDRAGPGENLELSGLDRPALVTPARD